jgi:predicted transcriptional regulator of viral defense system
MDDTKKRAPIQKLVQTPNRNQLYEIAAEQGGYFTTEQAGSSGYSRALISHHARSSLFIRVRRGLYRFREYPSSQREDVLAAWLTLGKDIAVVSYDSALDILGLSDVIPNAIHITVPRSKRNFTSRSGIKVHTTAKPILKKDTVIRDGIIVTSPARSILDAAEAGIAPEQIEIAVAQAINRGLATARQLQENAHERGSRVDKLIMNAIKKVKR